MYGINVVVVTITYHTMKYTAKRLFNYNIIHCIKLHTTILKFTTIKIWQYGQ